MKESNSGLTSEQKERCSLRRWQRQERPTDCGERDKDMSHVAGVLAPIKEGWAEGRVSGSNFCFF